MSSKTKNSAGNELAETAMGHFSNAMVNATLVNERMVALHKGNLETGAELSKLSIAFADQAAKRMQELARANIDRANAAFKSVAGAATPADFVAAQFDYMRALSDGFVAEMARSRAAAAEFSAEVLDAVAHRYSDLAENARTDLAE